VEVIPEDNVAASQSCFRICAVVKERSRLIHIKAQRAAIVLVAAFVQQGAVGAAKRVLMRAKAICAMNARASTLSTLTLMLLMPVSAGAQQITGTPGSPGATTTIDGQQLSKQRTYRREPAPCPAPTPFVKES
jgi:hypothetical protein